MSKAPAYARFIHTMTALRKELADPEFEGCDEILSHIAVRESEGKAVKITELVQSLQFGTGPTVHRKVTTLAERGLIGITQSKADGRAKNLSLTAAAMNHLKERTRLLKQSLED